ncbi:hypothetical protein ACVIGB_000765 [Bradyrhizobium sp. USDA 4341]
MLVDDQLSFDERFVLPLPTLAPPPVVAFSDRFASAFPQTVAQDVATAPATPEQVAAEAPAVESVMAAAPKRHASVPLPIKRPVVEARQRKAPAPMSVASTWRPEPPKEEPSIFEKLFGKMGSGTMMAYASADPAANVDVKLAPSSLYDRETAVYDISAKTVYLPNGIKLEAHSGLGEHLDNPSSERLRMRGVTPPHAYDLTLRESLFHGVQAIRLNPVGGEDKIHGRVGLLAHSYMLGVRGDSNGCVSIKDYAAFLRAYQNGEIKRLVVVAKLG